MESKSPDRLIVATDVSIPRETLLGFLNDCVEKMMDQREIEKLVDIHFVKNQALFTVMIDFQRDTYVE